MVTWNNFLDMCRQFGHWPSESFASPGLDWMEQAPSWKASSTSTSQVIVPEFHYRGHKSSPLVPVPNHLNQSIPSQPISSRYSLILSSHLRLGLPSSFVPSVCPTKTLYTTLLFPIRATCPVRLIVRFDYSDNIWWEIQIMKLLTVQLRPVPCHLVPRRVKYLPQHPILRHPQSVFFPQCERRNFIFIWNNGQNFISVYFRLYSRKAQWKTNVSVPNGSTHSRRSVCS